MNPYYRESVQLSITYPDKFIINYAKFAKEFLDV